MTTISNSSMSPNSVKNVMSSEKRVPDVMESPMCSHHSESSSSSEEDQFDEVGLPMPKLSSSTVPIVLEVTPRCGGRDIADPLFRGVCLYNGSMTDSQVEAYAAKQSRRDRRIFDEATKNQSSWFLPSIFQSISAKGSA